ncbi:hypothetical protein BO79DRAFT_229635 [Aspergillus costaricaensis CBS 115574]|uniref:Uncharacterized protein n=1 Tax=Aspergillus costaricaensis CBS 115574 TaxID=1448317 RepID=A0ACD1IAH4_9EURO|nr:hypothetical protein BO79DRAFT_229635 [Aspergillus costaricaensis CBS 115574]RAK87269.1 hypothetical protein BO79DRAFT_229635 [Aspergillus costaricaensis CBS 115574]
MPEGITIYERGTGPWMETGASLLDLDLEHPTKSFLIFSKRQTLNETKYLRLFTDEFQPLISKDINGSLFCDDVLDENDKPIKHVSWACYKIKHVRDPHTYEWVQTTVFVTWYPETQIQVVFIVDHPDPPSKLVAILPTTQANSNPYVWHAVIANTMVGVYDHSFWALRDLVRATEKSRVDVKSLTPDFFPHLHDIARHVFHSNETLEVAEHTMQCLVEEQARSYELYPDINKGEWLQNKRNLLRRAKDFHSLKIRSRSLSERLHNEINLGFNLVSQRFGHDAKSDSAMMRTVAIVSMVYLPGTFVSGLFGTNFFDYENGKEVMTSSFWIYWAITIPLTLITMFVWACWHYYPRKRVVGEERQRMMTFNGSQV